MRHIRGWSNLRSSNHKLEGAGDSRLVRQEEASSENNRISKFQGSEEEMRFCNPVFDQMSELLFPVPPVDTETTQSACPVSTAKSVPLQSNSCSSQRPRMSLFTIFIITTVLLFLLIFSITLGILIPQRKSEHLNRFTSLQVNNSNSSAPRTNKSSNSVTKSSPPMCGGFLSDEEGSFNSPNYPYLYPPNCHCQWVLEADEERVVQLKIISLDIEGYGSCPFDWLELIDGNTTTRFCGTVPPTTFISSSKMLQVKFVSDDSAGAMGFRATYRMIKPSQVNCSWDEFLCDQRKCLLLPALCDGVIDCKDQTDEENCSRQHWECGSSLNGLRGSFSSPNHPGPYPELVVCRWLISVPEGFIIQIQFLNFSLEAEEGCRFDYVEIHDSAGLGTFSLLGRFCGSELPPSLSSSGRHMTVIFVADEGVSDLGFYAIYNALNASESPCGPWEMKCGGGKCVSLQLTCDGWVDCPDGIDEQDCPESPDTKPVTPCQPVEVPVCQGLSYSLTVFPNLWVSLTEQPEASELLKGYKVLQELPCYPALRPLLCALLVPSCSAEGGVLQPCRSVCLNAEQLCVPQFHKMGISWPFHCDLLPTSLQQPDCVIP